MLNYVKQNIDNKGDPTVHKFVVEQGNDPFLIHVPDEFKDEEADRDYLESQEGEGGRIYRARQKIRKPLHATQVEYDAWRCSDRSVLMGSARNHAQGTVLVAPADLVKVFGLPEIGEQHTHISGTYSFEDNNLDMFTMYDFKATQAYYGFNREDEYYDNAKNLRKPLHKRKKRMPTVEEFWSQTEPYKFRIAAEHQCELPKFKRWLRQQIKEHGKPSDKSFTEINKPKFVEEVGISHGEWDKKAVFCHEVMAFNYDWTYHMTEQELKEYKGERPEKYTIPTAFDLNKAERVFADKDDIKLQEMEREAAKLKDTA